MSEGWFKVHRCLFEKAIWQQSTPEQKVILITLLGMANHKGREWEWQGKQFKAEPGEFVTSVNSIILRAGTGITRQNVRTALKKLEKYEFLTMQSTKTGLLIKIENWEVYQGRELPTNQGTNQGLTKSQPTGNHDLTNPQPTPNHDLTTNKNDKNSKNDKEGKEREEESSLPPLSYPTPIHKLAFDNFGEVSYRTWFDGADIKEDGELIIITVEEFKKKIVQDRYGPQIALLTGKKVSVKVGEQNG